MFVFATTFLNLLLLWIFFFFFGHHFYLSLCRRVEFPSVIVMHSVCRYGETHGDDRITSLPAPCPGENWRVGTACAFRTSNLLKKCYINSDFQKLFPCEMDRLQPVNVICIWTLPCTECCKCFWQYPRWDKAFQSNSRILVNPLFWQVTKEYYVVWNGIIKEHFIMFIC